MPSRTPPKSLSRTKSPGLSSSHLLPPCYSHHHDDVITSPWKLTYGTAPFTLMQPMRLQDLSQLGSRPGPAPPPPAQGLDAASRSDMEALIDSVTSHDFCLDCFSSLLTTGFFGSIWNMKYLNLWWCDFRLIIILMQLSQSLIFSYDFFGLTRKDNGVNYFKSLICVFQEK